MTDAPWAVVGCPRCRGVWLLDETEPAETTQCPGCERTHARHTLRRLATAETREAAAAERAAHLQRRAVRDSDGVDDANQVTLDDVESFAAMAQRVDSDSATDAQLVSEGLDAEWLAMEADARAGEIGAVATDYERDDGPRTTAEAVQAALVEQRFDTDPTLGVETEPDVEPAWPRDGSLTPVFPGEDTPLADATLRVEPRVSTFAGELVDQLLDQLAHAVRERARDRFCTTVDGRAPRVWRGWLTEEIGVTAWGGDYAALLARYALEELDQDERTELRDELTSVVTSGGATDGAASELVDGPLAALTLLEEPPTVAIRFAAAEWADVRRETGQRALDALQAAARVADVRCLVTSPALADTLARFEHGMALTELRDATRNTPADADADEAGGTPHGRAVIEAMDAWKPGYGRILHALPTDRPRQQRTLADDPDVDLSKSAVSRYLPALVDARLITRDTDSRPLTVSLTSTGAAVREHLNADDGSVRDPQQTELPTEFTAPPHSDVGAVCRTAQGREGGEVDRRQSVEAYLADTGTPESPYDYTRWLWGPSAEKDAYVAHRRYTAQAAGTVTCVDARIREFDDGRVSWLSEIDDEVLLALEWGGPLSTMARVAASLLSRKALSKLLTPERVGAAFDGLATGDDRRLTALDAALEDVLQRGMQLGWLSEDELEWEAFRNRISGVRAACLETLADVAGTECWDERGELMCDLIGLVTVATHLYRAAGYDLVINVRAPDTANIANDEVRREDFLKWFQALVPKQAAYDGQQGPLSHYRETHEERLEKRRFRLPRDDAEEMGAADPTVQWVVTGRTATELRADLEHAIHEQPFEQVADGEEPAPYLDVDVVNGNSYRAIRGVVEDFAQLKEKSIGGVGQDRKQALDRLTRLAISATATNDRPHHGNPMAVAEGLVQLGRARSPGSRLTLSDVEAAVARMSTREFLPDLAPSASAFIQTLLDADDAMARSELLARTGLSTSTWERQRATAAAAEGPGDLRAAEELGILQPADEGDTFVATLEPWWIDRSDRRHPEGEPDDIAGPRASTHADLVCELADALDVELPADVLAWPPDLADAFREPELYQWRAFLWAAVASGDEYETGPPGIDAPRELGWTRLGVASDDAPPIPDAQRTLQSATNATGGLEKVADGGREGVE